MTSEIIKAKTTLLGIAGIITAVGVIWAFTMSMWDEAHADYIHIEEGPFLTIKEYKLANAESTIQELQNEVDSLQWDVDNGQASEKDKWLLQQKKRQLQEWQQKVQKILSGRITA